MIEDTQSNFQVADLQETTTMDTNFEGKSSSSRLQEQEHLTGIDSHLRKYPKGSPIQKIAHQQPKARLPDVERQDYEFKMNTSPDDDNQYYDAFQEEPSEMITPQDNMKQHTPSKHVQIPSSVRYQSTSPKKSDKNQDLDITTSTKMASPGSGQNQAKSQEDTLDQDQQTHMTSTYDDCQNFKITASMSPTRKESKSQRKVEKMLSTANDHQNDNQAISATLQAVLDNDVQSQEQRQSHYSDDEEESERIKQATIEYVERLICRGADDDSQRNGSEDGDEQMIVELNQPIPKRNILPEGFESDDDDQCKLNSCSLTSNIVEEAFKRRRDIKKEHKTDEDERPNPMNDDDCCDFDDFTLKKGNLKRDSMKDKSRSQSKDSRNHHSQKDRRIQSSFHQEERDDSEKDMRRMDNNRSKSKYPSEVVSNKKDMSSGNEVYGDSQEGQFVNYPEISQKSVAILKERGIKYLFPIQQECFYPIYEGKDLIGRDLTGSGKTLAFVLPLLERLRKTKKLGTRKIQAIVLAPTRELAVQVQNVFAQMKHFDDEYRTLTVYGGVPIDPQTSALTRGVDIFVGTTGRVLDHIERGNIDFSGIKSVFLDEADVMLKLGFKEDVDKILSIIRDQCREDIQICLFSATIPPWVRDIAQEHLRQGYTMVDLAKDLKNKTAKRVRHIAINCPFYKTEQVILDLLMMYGTGGRSIVFTKTKSDANSLISSDRFSKNDIQVMHGDIPQHSREMTLRAFKEGRLKVLVATDVASRGLDIPNVELIVQTEPPQDPETYIHRAGRTARAGKEGTCIVLYQNKTQYMMEQIEQRAGIQFEQMSAPSPSEVMNAKQKLMDNQKKSGKNGQGVVNNIMEISQVDENFNIKDHFEEAQELLTQFEGDAKKALCRAIALIKNLQTKQQPIERYNPDLAASKPDYQNSNTRVFDKENRSNTFNSQPTGFGRGRGGFAGNTMSRDEESKPFSRGRGQSIGGAGPGVNQFRDFDNNRNQMDRDGDGKSSKYSHMSNMSRPSQFNYSTPQSSVHSTPSYNSHESFSGRQFPMQQQRTPQVSGAESYISQTPADFRDEDSSRIIFMSNIHYKCSESDLFTLFRENNLRVSKLIIHRDKETGQTKGSGLCMFESPREAQLAIQRLNGFEYMERGIVLNPHMPRSSVPPQTFPPQGPPPTHAMMQNSGIQRDSYPSTRGVRNEGYPSTMQGGAPPRPVNNMMRTERFDYEERQPYKSQMQGGPMNMNSGPSAPYQPREFPPRTGYAGPSANPMNNNPMRSAGRGNPMPRY